MSNKTLISNINSMEDNETWTYDTRSISTVFKNFFSSLAESLLIKLPNPPNRYNLESINYFSFTIADDFCLNKTSENKFLNIILKMRYLKLLVQTISRGVFPDTCKVLKLKPIYKKRKMTDPFNYIPISLLLIISKVVEKIVHDQTNKFLSENNILYNFQSGIRPNHSRNLYLANLTDKIVKKFDEGLLTVIIFKKHLTQ